LSGGRLVLQRAAHRIEAVANGARLRRLAGEGEVGVVAHPPVGGGLDQVGRRGAEVDLPAELDDVVEPFLLGGGRDDQPVAGEAGERDIHRAGHGIFDRDDVGDVGEAGAERGAHQVAGVGMAPEGEAEAGAGGDMGVVGLEDAVLAVHEMQDRRVDHGEFGASRLGVVEQFERGVEVLVGAGHDDAGAAVARAAGLLDRDLAEPLALGHGQGEELALLAGHEEAVDREVVDPVAQVGPEARLVDPAVGVERRQRRRPDPAQPLAREGLGVAHPCRVRRAPAVSLALGPRRIISRIRTPPSRFGKPRSDFV
jgi:hypothetical protein